ncbi:Growth-regulating factor 5, partial [Striga hermonthica]
MNVDNSNLPVSRHQFSYGLDWGPVSSMLVAGTNKVEQKLVVLIFNDSLNSPNNTFIKNHIVHNYGRFPFTASQWEELEQQALVFKYMVSGALVPPDLIFTLQRSLQSSLSSKILLHQPQIGWSNGYGSRKIDPEPGRCRRTDGKKWRCSKDTYADSKYCERHMHRGRNRSRKPVEIQSPSSPPEKMPGVFPVSRNALSSVPSQRGFVYSPHLSSQESSHSKLFFESTDFTLSPNKAYRNMMGDGIKEETDNEHAFFSMKDDEPYYSSSGRHKSHEQHYYNNRDVNLLGVNIGRKNDEPKKVMHHFLEECPPKEEDKSSSNRPINSDLSFSVTNRNNTQLSIPAPNSLHDFFLTQK